MDEARAREILGDALDHEPNLSNIDGEYLRWERRGGGTSAACLDDDEVLLYGEFTIEQLEAIAWWMRHKHV